MLTNVAGQIEVNLNFDPGEQVIDSLAVYIGAMRAGKFTYITNPAAGIITVSINTANFVKDPALGTATVDFLNGNSTVSAAIYPRGVATATATQTTPIVLNNVDGWAADITKPSVNANSPAGLTYWGGPTARRHGRDLPGHLHSGPFDRDHDVDPWPRRRPGLRAHYADCDAVYGDLRVHRGGGWHGHCRLHRV